MHKAKGHPAAHTVTASLVRTGRSQSADPPQAPRHQTEFSAHRRRPPVTLDSPGDTCRIFSFFPLISLSKAVWSPWYAHDTALADSYIRKIKM